MRDASICGLGQTASSAIESAIGRGIFGGACDDADPAAPRRMVEFEVDGEPVKVFEGQTILDGLNKLGITTPTLCYGETLHAGERLPRLRGRDRGRPRAGAVVLAQGRGRG